MTSLVRISESGRKENKPFMVQKWRGKEAESPEGKEQKEVPHPLHFDGKDKESTSLCNFWK